VKSNSDTLTPSQKGLMAAIGPILFLASTFYLNFISRIIFAPLMPTIEKNLAIRINEILDSKSVIQYFKKEAE
jgi:hypothetical protein